MLEATHGAALAPLPQRFVWPVACAAAGWNGIAVWGQDVETCEEPWQLQGVRCPRCGWDEALRLRPRTCQL